MCEIDTAETYEKGRPKRGGLSDPRMGTMDRAMACETDGMNIAGYEHLQVRVEMSRKHSKQHSHVPIGRQYGHGGSA